MKKKLAIVLASVAAIATIFTGCGKGKDISGHYVAQMASNEMFSPSEIEDLKQSGIYISDLALDTNIDFTDDNKFTMTFDTTPLNDGLNKVLDEKIDTIAEEVLNNQGIPTDQLTDEDGNKSELNFKKQN